MVTSIDAELNEDSDEGVIVDGSFFSFGVVSWLLCQINKLFCCPVRSCILMVDAVASNVQKLIYKTNSNGSNSGEYVPKVLVDKVGRHCQQRWDLR